MLSKDVLKMHYKHVDVFINLLNQLFYDLSLSYLIWSWLNVVTIIFIQVHHMTQYLTRMSFRGQRLNKCDFNTCRRKYVLTLIIFRVHEGQSLGRRSKREDNPWMIWFYEHNESEWSLWFITRIKRWVKSWKLNHFLASDYTVSLNSYPLMKDFTRYKSYLQ